MTQSEVPDLLTRVEIVLMDYQGPVEEDLLTFRLRDPVPLPVLLRIAGIPLEFGALSLLAHGTPLRSIRSSYTESSNRTGRRPTSIQTWSRSGIRVGISRS